MEIREAVETDLPELVRLDQSSFTDPWSEKEIKSSLSERMYTWLVIPDGEKLLGYACLQSIIDEGTLQNIAVDSDFRNRGLGTKLLSAVRERAEDAGLMVLFLEVRESNAPAITLYEHGGYRCFGVRTNYYDNPQENALLYRLDLQ